MEEIPFAGPAFIINNSEKFKDFEGKFKARTKQSPSYDVEYTYDAFSLLLEGIRQGGNEPNKILQAILSMKEFNGISGNMKINLDGNVTVHITMGVYHNGKMTPLQERSPLDYKNEWDNR